MRRPFFSWKKLLYYCCINIFFFTYVYGNLLESFRFYSAIVTEQFISLYPPCSSSPISTVTPLPLQSLRVLAGVGQKSAVVAEHQTNTHHCYGNQDRHKEHEATNVSNAHPTSVKIVFLIVNCFKGGERENDVEGVVGPDWRVVLELLGPKRKIVTVATTDHGLVQEDHSETVGTNEQAVKGGEEKRKKKMSVTTFEVTQFSFPLLLFSCDVLRPFSSISPLTCFQCECGWCCG